jgi:glycosyltransferase involved in cell wall biosynthesis
MMGQRFLARLRSLAGTLRRVRVIFPGHLGGVDKWAALEMASQFVVCSRHESYGLTIMEAMAAGCPVVAVRSYGVEATVDEQCGRIVEGGAESVWREISALLQDPALAARLGAAGRERASAQGFEQAAGELLRLCQGSHR